MWILICLQAWGADAPAFTALQHREAPVIAAHLHDVESRLRARTPKTLSATQRSERLRLLDALHDYHEQGVFPHNHEAPAGRARPSPFPEGFPAGAGRTPVFVDEHGTHCAVGELLRVDGQHELIAGVVDTNNLAWIHELDAPALEGWASEHGFTVDELAMIQPSYPGEPVDADGDGWLSDSDCDDTDAEISPDATEVCDDGVDNNCDEAVDEEPCVEEERGCGGQAALWLFLPLPLLGLRSRRR